MKLELLREHLKDLCINNNVDYNSMKELTYDYYIKTLKWSELKALNYSIQLINDGYAIEIERNKNEN